MDDYWPPNKAMQPTGPKRPAADGQRRWAGACGAAGLAHAESADHDPRPSEDFRMTLRLFSATSRSLLGRVERLLGLALAVCLCLAVHGCASTSAGREVVSLAGPGGRRVNVSKPADEVLNGQIGLGLKAMVPGLRKDIEVAASYEARYEKVREVAPTQQEFEVLRYLLALV